MPGGDACAVRRDRAGDRGGDRADLYREELRAVIGPAGRGPPEILLRAGMRMASVAGRAGDRSERNNATFMCPGLGGGGRGVVVQSRGDVDGESVGADERG